MASIAEPIAHITDATSWDERVGQLLNATAEKRGDLIEDAVSALFDAHHVQYIRTGSHNQADIADRFEVTVQPAPDFVVYDQADNLRAMLECKGANDGGTARDKALRFARLHDESVRLGGIPLVAILGGLGWTRVNDTLGPVIRHCGSGAAQRAPLLQTSVLLVHPAYRTAALATT